MVKARFSPFTGRLANPSFRTLGIGPRFARIAGLALGIALGVVVASNAEPPEGSPRGNVDLPRFPSISPDGSTVVFSWRGDLWKVSRDGGKATRLTSHPAREHDSAWSPDGSRIVFESDRDGVTNLWSMTPEGTDLRRVTTLDTGVDLGDVCLGIDGEPEIMFSAYLEAEPYRSTRPYEVPLIGGEPRRSHDAFGGAAVRSEDGRRVAFERGGARTTRRHYRGEDRRSIWTFDPTLGTFSSLSEWKGNEFDPRWSGSDGVLFLSDRLGDTVNIHHTSVDDGATEPITRFEEIDVHSFDATPDGRFVVLHRWDQLYSIDLDDEDPTPRPIHITAAEDSLEDDRVVDVSRRVTEASMNPDGKSMAMVAYGDIFVRGTEDDSETFRVTRTPGREFDIAWSPDGRTLYFTAVDQGETSIRAAVVERTRGEIREAHSRVAAPADADVDPADSEVGEDAETTDTDVDVPEAEVKASEDEDGSNDTLDDGSDRWVDVRGVRSSVLIDGVGHPRDPMPSPDGTRIAFVRNGGDLTIRDLDTGEDMLLQPGWDAGIDATWSPDGDWIAFAQSDLNFNRDVFVVPADGSAEPSNISMHPDNDRSPRFSGDGRVLAFASERGDEDYDVYLVMLDAELEKLAPRELEEYFEDRRAAAKKRKPLDPKISEEAVEEEDAEEGEEKEDDGSEVAEAGSGSVGKSEGMDDTSPVETEEAVEPAFDQEDLDTAYLRLRRVTDLPGNVSGLELLPAGDEVVFGYGTDAPNAEGLYKIAWDGGDRKRLRDTMSLMHLNLSGNTLVGVDRSQAVTVDVAKGGKTETVPIKDRIRISRVEESGEKFREAASIMGQMFYDPTMKNLDWSDVSDRYHGLARGTRTADEFNWVGDRMLGELSSSHQGIRAPRRSLDATASYGRLGIRVEPVEDGYQVLETTPEGPAEESDTPLQVGDVVVGIEGRAFDLESAPPETITSRLEGRSGKETLVTVRRDVGLDAPAEIDLLLVPITRRAESQLRYREMQRRRTALVDDWSGGRLGYAHIRGMDQRSLDEFERDLFAAAAGRDGLLVDVRDNGGGWTTDRLLASIMVQPHAYTVPRGADPAVTGGYPQDRLFIQRYTLPMNMLCNEKSYSNAEIISHAFKTLDRGTLVGQQTHGSVISTGGTSLVDGTTVRLPFRGWFLPDGTDMENNGAMPDIVVVQRPRDEVEGKDPQLKAAVEDLLRRIDVEGMDR